MGGRRLAGPLTEGPGRRSAIAFPAAAVQAVIVVTCVPQTAAADVDYSVCLINY